MRTSRPVAEKLGTVRQDPDLNGLLFILIIRATGGRQERAAQLGHMYVTGQGRGLTVVVDRTLFRLYQQPVQLKGNRPTRITDARRPSGWEGEAI